MHREYTGLQTIPAKHEIITSSWWSRSPVYGGLNTRTLDRFLEYWKLEAMVGHEHTSVWWLRPAWCHRSPLSDANCNFNFKVNSWFDVSFRFRPDKAQKSPYEQYFSTPPFLFLFEKSVGALLFNIGKASYYTKEQPGLKPLVVIQQTKIWRSQKGSPKPKKATAKRNYSWGRWALRYCWTSSWISLNTLCASSVLCWNTSFFFFLRTDCLLLEDCSSRPYDLITINLVWSSSSMWIQFEHKILR